MDVYGDIEVDYEGDKVTAKNFLNVIQGIKEGDTANGPVLESKPTDNVFIYYSDHGATGLVAMPSGDPLYASDLNAALKHMHDTKMFHQLVFYLEACESGSMFDGILSDSSNVFATTASTPSQSSYAYYFNETLSTYMADEYSIRWMQDSTQNWDDYESLISQFQDVADAVKESQPQKYGDSSFEGEAIECFEAFEDRHKRRARILELLRNSTSSVVQEEADCDSDCKSPAMSVSSRDVKLAVLQNRYLLAKDVESKMRWALLVEEEIDYRFYVDLMFDELVRYIVGHSENVFDGMTKENAIKVIKHGHIRPTNYLCLKYAYKIYEEHCDKFGDYSLQYVSVLVNLCEIYGDANVIQDAFETICE